MATNLRLRDVRQTDIEVFFAHQLDAKANYMAAFTAKDPADKVAFEAKWEMILSTDSIAKQTILFHDEVAGHIVKYQSDVLAGPEITYWIGRQYWGNGIASWAAAEFLKLVKDRPIYARAVADNRASIRVLEKCGFTVIANETGYANGRGESVDEVVMMKSDHED